MKETIEHNNRFYGEELKTESEQLKEWLIVANKEIERLNNIINELEKYFEQEGFWHSLDKIKELKGSEKE